MSVMEIDKPAASWVRLTSGPCDGHELVVQDLVVHVAATRDDEHQRWSVHAYSYDEPILLVATEAVVYRRGAHHDFHFEPQGLAFEMVDGQPTWESP